MRENFSARLIFCIFERVDRINKIYKIEKGLQTVRSTTRSGSLDLLSCKSCQSCPSPWLIHDPHLPKHECIVKSCFVNRIVTARSAAVTCAHVHLTAFDYAFMLW